MVNQPKPTVAIFGGSFDPPHKGHQRIVENAIEHLNIDKLLVVPTYLNPFKSFSFASAAQRLEWCHILFDDLNKVIVSPYEIQEGKRTTTSQTVKHFNTVYHVKYLIIGSDNLSTLTKWHQFEWLNTHITWVVITRNGYPLQIDALRSYKILTLDAMISSSRIRNEHNLRHVDKKIKQSVRYVLQGNN